MPNPIGLCKDPRWLAGTPRLQGATVLVVEDEFMLLIELAAVLKDAGAERVLACRSIEQALALCEASDINAAVLDVRIGYHSVAPVAQWLTERGVPFLFYTGQVGNDPAIARWRTCPILSKPASPTAIVAAVADLLHT